MTQPEHEAPTDRRPARLRPPRHRVEPRAKGLWTVHALLVVLPPVAALAVLAILLPPARGWLTAGLVVVAVLGIGYVLVMPRWRYRVHRWETTEEAVYTASGWLRQEWRVAPMSRIQTIDTSRGPLQRMFRLSSLTITTASAKGAIAINGLDHEIADDLAHQLTAITQATPGDAT
ncbi:PH domain-containing protein [Stackebrandtia nassauensis]|uniref:Membrane-flanked domain protein n=1 Tax=Stackebrandtia nassauensis (strain DSM 44728 / CIP 108903 / NRRL B-16338 / NBRC 102104 / LLR-40K-21) TaxID=446470 RepID=D3Q8C2_STANL|nr:PH domain-containing protein [Stackebrandtia nassauensis]ADD42496.1 membrane-flanked domain protein [Stackebrandtia nassauensis DSM 44728]